MKKYCIAIAMVTFGIMNAEAQKMMTRTGKISFFSSTPVENIEAFNNDVASVLDAKTGDMVFVAPIKSFKFEKQLMQDHFNESYMESDKYPKAEFKGKVVNISTINFSKDGTYPVKTVGKLTIHGVTNDVTIPGSITVKGNTAIASSKFKVKTEDYKIEIPSIAVGKIAKEIEVTVNSILEAK